MADDDSTAQPEGAPTGPGRVPGPLEPEPVHEPDDDSGTTRDDDPDDDDLDE